MIAYFVKGPDHGRLREVPDGTREIEVLLHEPARVYEEWNHGLRDAIKRGFYRAIQGHWDIFIWTGVR